VSSLELGSVAYTKDELLAIFATPVRGNGLVSLAHQLIAAKLNVAAGADDAEIAAAIAEADALIGGRVVPPVGDGRLAPDQASALVEELDAFNNGRLGGACEGAPDDDCEPGDGGDCDGDDGDDPCEHDTDHDGDCDGEEPPPAPVCGNGALEEGEACDDGNTHAGDGCSATCTIEVLPVCGNGIVEAGEECDDGNTHGGDGCSATCKCEPTLS
jgi:cysteine-rich repeat protein